MYTVNVRHARATRIVLGTLKKQIAVVGSPHGRAWNNWENWTRAQRKHFLSVWMQLSPAEVEHFHSLAWFSLNKHVRVSVKKFFDTNPIVDTILGAMRYPAKVTRPEEI